MEYTAENQNLIGIGVFNGQEGTQFGFRGIVSDNVSLTVTLDSDNSAIVLSFNDDLLVEDIPTATETQRGIAEIATQAETNAGVVDNVIVTPLKLGARTSTETRAGIAEIATQAEVTTGTDDTRIVSPLKLATFAGTQKTTRTFADSVSRAAAVPTFDGQLGVQLDSNALIMATGTVAGSFSTNIGILGSLTLFGGDITGVGELVAGSINVSEITTPLFAVGASFNFLGDISFESGTTFQFNGTPATESVLVGRASGAAEPMLITDFLSADNTSTGWTGFSNSTVRKTGDCNTITLPQLAQVVDTLIHALGTSRLLPIP